MVALELLAIPSVVRVAELLLERTAGQPSKPAARKKRTEQKPLLRVQPVWAAALVNDISAACVTHEVILDILSTTIAPLPRRAPHPRQQQTASSRTGAGVRPGLPTAPFSNENRPVPEPELV